MQSDLLAAQAGDEDAFRRLVAPFRRELAAHCYRMAGGLHDAEDLLQESLLRAWRALPGFGERASLRTWLYRVTTSACLDALERKGPRLLPMDLGPPNGPMAPPRDEPVWLEPCPPSFYADVTPSPEARYSARESVAFAFLVAVQRLPPRQRAVLLLRDVLGYAADECAALLEMSVAAANSALQRARETLPGAAAQPRPPADGATRALLERYVRAWEQADVSALVALLHDEATLTMPPLPAWVRGARAIGASLAAMVLTPDARGRFRFEPTEANGLPALAAYDRTAGGAWRAASLHVIDVEGDRIAGITAFVDPSLFAPLGLPGATTAARHEARPLSRF